MQHSLNLDNHLIYHYYLELYSSFHLISGDLNYHLDLLDLMIDYADLNEIGFVEILFGHGVASYNCLSVKYCSDNYYCFYLNIHYPNIFHFGVYQNISKFKLKLIKLNINIIFLVKNITFNIDEASVFELFSFNNEPF